MSSISTHRLADQEADAQAVREELRRIVSSPPFEDSERLVRFLTFVVEEKLVGRGNLLKESVIGLEVFGRSAGYDPKIDPIVRVQARRLRSKLETWYQTGGQNSPVRITLPKGGYVPEIGSSPAPEAEPMPAAAAPQVRRPRMVWIAAAGALVFVALAAAILTKSRGRAPSPGSRLFTAYSGYQTSPAFSPDGLSLAFSWGGPDGDNIDIWVQALDADTPRRLTTAPRMIAVRSGCPTVATLVSCAMPARAASP